MTGERPTGTLAERESDGLTAGRLEGFSDGVLAIAITLLVLQLGSGEGEGSLAHRLGEEWPFFLSYFISFLNIGVVWLNHHKVISRLRRVDHTFLVLNLILLMVVAVLPFPTRVVGEELANGSGTDQLTAALIYAGNFLLASIAFYALWLWASRGGRLLRSGVPEQLNRVRSLRFALAIPVFAIPCGLAFIAPLAAVVADGLIMGSFLLSDATTDGLMMRLARVER